MTSVTIKIELETEPNQPQCTRIMDVPLAANMLGLHLAIQSAFSWQDVNPFHFEASHIYGAASDATAQTVKIGGEDCYRAEFARVENLLRRCDDQITYSYGPWKAIITVTEVEGRQKRRAKLVDLDGVSPMEESDQVSGGWEAMRQTLAKVYDALNHGGEISDYEQLSADEHAMVASLGGPHSAYQVASQRLHPSVDEVGRELYKIDVFPRIEEVSRGFNIRTEGLLPASFFEDLVNKLDQLKVDNIYSWRIKSQLESHTLTATTDLDELFADLKKQECARHIACEPAYSPAIFSRSEVTKMIEGSCSAWNMVLRLVREVSPYPQVAEAIEKTIHQYRAATLTVDEINAMVNPLRECLRIVGSDHGQTNIESLVDLKWQTFSEIIGCECNSREVREDFLFPYLEMGVHLGLMRSHDWRGRMELTPYGQSLVAEPDFSKSETEHVRVDKEFFDGLVSRIPHGHGPTVIYAVARLSIYMSLGELRELVADNDIDETHMYEVTLRKLARTLNLELPFGGTHEETAYVTSIMRLLEVSSFLDVDHEAGTHNLNSAGQRFLSLCFSTLTFSQVVEGLYEAVNYEEHHWGSPF